MVFLWWGQTVVQGMYSHVTGKLKFLRWIDFQISLATHCIGLYYKEDEIHKITVIFKQMLKLVVKQ